MTFRTNFAILLAVYLAAMAWVWTGSLYYSNGERFPMMVLHLGAVAVSGAIFFALPIGRLVNFDRPSWPRATVAGIGTASLILIIAHWSALGSLPIIDTFLTNDYLTIGLIRTHIPHVDVPLVNYIPTLVLKAGLPFLVVYLFARGKDALAFTFLAVGLFYGISLLQKSYPLYVTIPPCIYLLLRWKPFKSAIVLFLAVTSVALLMFSSNPALRPWVDSHELQESKARLAKKQADEEKIAGRSVKEIASSMGSSVLLRVAMDPGFTVNQWFQAFPEKFAFNYGCGYRFIAPLKGCEFTPNSTRTWQLNYPYLEARGYNGSSGAAHFMEEYANFGTIGLALAGFLAVAVLAVAATATVGLGWPAVIAFNVPFIMALSSTGLHTTLLSGGWALMLILSLLWPNQTVTGKLRLGNLAA